MIQRQITRYVGLYDTRFQSNGGLVVVCDVKGLLHRSGGKRLLQSERPPHRCGTEPTCHSASSPYHSPLPKRVLPSIATFRLRLGEGSHPPHVQLRSRISGALCLPVKRMEGQRLSLDLCTAPSPAISLAVRGRLLWQCGLDVDFGVNERIGGDI